MRRERQWGELDSKDQKLLLLALAASANAYAPYSTFAVGAAVRTRGGGVFTGANVENAAYGVVLCAETSAVSAATAAGDFTLDTIAVVGHSFTAPLPAAAKAVTTPCGRCRQIIYEAADNGGNGRGDSAARVLSANGDLSQIVEATIDDLLPDAFGPRNLGLHEHWPEMQARLRRRVAELETQRR